MGKEFIQYCTGKNGLSGKAIFFLNTNWKCSGSKWYAHNKYTSTREGTTFKLPFCDRYFTNAGSIYTGVARMWKMLIGVCWQERKHCYNKRTLNPGMCAKSKTIQSTLLPRPCHSLPSEEKVIWFTHSTEVKINMIGRSHHWDSLAAFQST